MALSVVYMALKTAIFVFILCSPSFLSPTLASQRTMESESCRFLFFILWTYLALIELCGAVEKHPIFPRSSSDPTFDREPLHSYYRDSDVYSEGDVPQREDEMIFIAPDHALPLSSSPPSSVERERAEGVRFPVNWADDFEDARSVDKEEGIPSSEKHDPFLSCNDFDDVLKTVSFAMLSKESYVPPHPCIVAPFIYKFREMIGKGRLSLVYIVDVYLLSFIFNFSSFSFAPYSLHG